MKCGCQLQAWVTTPSEILAAPRLEITHCASSFLPDTEALPEEDTGSPETLTLFGQRLIFSSVSFSAMAYSFTSSDTPTI